MCALLAASVPKGLVCGNDYVRPDASTVSSSSWVRLSVAMPLPLGVANPLPHSVVENRGEHSRNGRNIGPQINVSSDQPRPNTYKSYAWEVQYILSHKLRNSACLIHDSHGVAYSFIYLNFSTVTYAKHKRKKRETTSIVIL